jgi:hypothetical protein
VDSCCCGFVLFVFVVMTNTFLFLSTFFNFFFFFFFNILFYFCYYLLTFFFPFSGIGNNGGAICVNVNSFTTVLSVVNLASFCYCTANRGGALYIQTTGIKLMDVKFSSNGALEV